MILRSVRNNILKQDERELYLAVERVKIADFRNAHRGKNSREVRPTDIFQLSFDRVIEEDELTDELIEKMRYRFKKKQ